MAGLLMRQTRLNGQAPFISTRISIFVVLNLLDYVLSAIAIHYGLGTELNPLMKGLPLWGMGLAKLGAVALIILLVGHKITIMRMLNVAMALVVAWNLTWVVMCWG